MLLCPPSHPVKLSLPNIFKYLEDVGLYWLLVTSALGLKVRVDTLLYASSPVFDQFNFQCNTYHPSRRWPGMINVQVFSQLTTWQIFLRTNGGDRCGAYLAPAVASLAPLISACCRSELYSNYWFDAPSEKFWIRLWFLGLNPPALYYISRYYIYAFQNRVYLV